MSRDVTPVLVAATMLSGLRGHMLMKWCLRHGRQKQQNTGFETRDLCTWVAVSPLVPGSTFRPVQEAAKRLNVLLCRASRKPYT